MISRRSPASSSFVLAAARLRALQLDPARAAGRPGQLRGRIQKNSQASPAARVVTGPGPYALLTLVALMGADERKLYTVYLCICLHVANAGGVRQFILMSFLSGAPSVDSERKDRDAD
jgi:hypothetical protein